MKKVVVNAVVKTILVLLGLLILSFAIINFFFPATMVSCSEDLGNYGMAMLYQDSIYRKTDDIADLDLCFDYAIQDNNYAKTIHYGILLEERSDFETYCASLDDSVLRSYKQMVYAKVAIAYVATDNTEKGIEHATSVVSSFQTYNALSQLAIWATTKNEKTQLTNATASQKQAILVAMQQFPSDEKDYTTICNSLQA